MFKIKVEPEVVSDIQEGVDWYNEKQPGLGRKFYFEVRAAFTTLKKMPYFQVRYDAIRCFPLKKFPYMVHYSIDEGEKLVIIRAVFNTSQDPSLWSKRNIS